LAPNCFLMTWIRVSVTLGVTRPFLVSDLEGCPAPLLVMAKDGNRGKRPWSEGSSHDGRQSPSHQLQMDTGPDQALSSTRWGFSPCRLWHGLASCDDDDRSLMVDVGLLLLQTRR
jgi:hypothetical protein